MSVKIGAFQEQILNQLRQMRQDAQSAPKEALGEKAGGGMSFADHLSAGIKEANGLSQKSDKMAVELASGKSENVHETMLAATQAELSFNLMVQLRNKALEAYTEVMRMPV